MYNNEFTEQSIGFLNLIKKILYTLQLSNFCELMMFGGLTISKYWWDGVIIIWKIGLWFTDDSEKYWSANDCLKKVTLAAVKLRNNKVLEI